MDNATIVTIVIAVVGWIFSLVSVWAKGRDLLTNAIETERKARTEMAAELWRGINMSITSAVQTRGEIMTAIERNSGRIDTLETIFWQKQRERAARDLHKPTPSAKEMDDLLDKIIAGIATKEETALIRAMLRAHVESTEADTGERALLEAMNAMDDPPTPMPIEPPDKEPDLPYSEHHGMKL